MAQYTVKLKSIIKKTSITMSSLSTTTVSLWCFKVVGECTIERNFEDNVLPPTF